MPPGSVPTGTRSGLIPISTGADLGLEPTSWELWWRYNRDAYLDLKAKVEAIGPSTLGDVTATADERVAFGIDALSAALPRERQRDLVSSLLVALARSCDDAAHARGPAITQLLAPFVADPDQEIGETAALALGILRHHAAIPDLASLLHDDEAGRKLARGRVSTRTRAFAAYALGIAAARSEREDLQAFVAHHLQRTLETSTGTASADLAAACVIALGLVPMPVEEGADNGHAASIRPRSGASLDDFPPRSRSAQAAVLARFLNDGDRPVLARAHVPDALARLGIGAGTDLRGDIARELAAVLERQSREDAGVVRGAVLALGRLADSDSDAADVRMRATLKRALDAGDAQARLFALVSLAQVAGRRGDAEDASAVQSEVQSLLLERLVRGKARERSWSALALGILERGRAAQMREGSSAVRAALRRALADASAADQIGALAIGIGLCGDRSATKDLLAKLDDVRDPAGRGHIATALGLLGAPEAVKPLRAILQKSRFQPELLRETAIALALLGDVDLESALIGELRDARSLASQAAIARALGFAGKLATVDPLAKMLGDSSLTAGARAFSAVALGMICDRERLPWNAFLSIGVNYPSAPATLSDGSAGVLDIL
ncbi:MAG: hypothetical protein NTY35_13535 [Planctomycetota bacterium]|nr:hypothetical protein [Planctomycetota bacterium]